MYIPWIRGEMLRTRHGQVPSFDAPDSFMLRIQKGVARLKLSDLQAYLNQSLPASAPFRNVSLQAKDGHLQLHGSVHKLVSLPVELDGMLIPEPNERIRFRMTRLTVLKIPFKGLFHLFGVQLSDLVPKSGVAGVQVLGNDVLFDTQQLLPAPHLLGVITSVAPVADTLQVVYGDAKVDDVRLAQWHNFIKLTGGTLNFGKLTMRDVDLTMIDASNDPWFDLDLAHYQSQLVYGQTRMTANAGLEVYVPDIDELPAKQVRQGVTLQWLKNRNANASTP